MIQMITPWIPSCLYRSSLVTLLSHVLELSHTLKDYGESVSLFLVELADSPFEVFRGEVGVSHGGLDVFMPHELLDRG